jgi:hypothetical protein
VWGDEAVEYVRADLVSSPEQQVDSDAIALAAVEAIFADLRDRRFLKWLFDPRGDFNVIGHFDDGDELTGLDLATQGQIKAAWQIIIANALSTASTEGSEG